MSIDVMLELELDKQECVWVSCERKRESGLEIGRHSRCTLKYKDRRRGWNEERGKVSVRTCLRAGVGSE